MKQELLITGLTDEAVDPCEEKLNETEKLIIGEIMRYLQSITSKLVWPVMPEERN